MGALERYSIQSDLALFGNIRLAWKGLLETKAPAYFVKSLSLMLQKSKLECLLLDLSIDRSNICS